MVNDSFTKKVEALIAAREAARQARRFGRADALREELLALNVEIQDTPEGTTWQCKSQI